jgi:hypothetical protein
MTARCYDFPGPRDRLVTATSGGWVPFDEQGAAKLAASAMLLACSPEHVERLRRDSALVSQSSPYTATVRAPAP